MSGFEIAGIILGGLSFLAVAVESLDKLFERTAKWRQFRKHLLLFIDAINAENQLFENMLCRFRHSVGVPRDEVNLLLKDRNYEGWHREELTAVFNLRLGKSYKGFKSWIKIRDSLIVKLKKLLASKDKTIDWPEESLSGFEYQVKRIQYSFSNSVPKALVELEKCTQKLREILDSAEKMETMGWRKDNLAEAILFSHVRKYSQSLHKAIEAGWSCECRSAHEVSIQLQNRTSVDSSMIFNLAFRYPEISKTPLYQSDEQRSRTLYKWRKVAITRKALGIPDSILPASPQQLSVAGNVRQMLHQNFESEPNSSSNARASQLKRSNSSDSPSSSTQAPSAVLNDIKIHNLCNTVCNFVSTNNSYLGYLPADHSERYDLRYSDDNVTSQAFYRGEFVSLETILSKPDKFSPLNCYERYKVAYILASSLLQLQNAPWLTNNLQKRHILFPCDWSNHKILIDQPHLSHSFLFKKSQTIPSEQTPNLSSSVTTVKKSLIDLGIILLELCFGQRIEEQSIWQDFLVDGKEHASTNYLTALEWADAVYEQEPDLEHVIKCCMFCLFKGKLNWDNLKFTQAVYASVVEPLEKIVNRWQNVL